MATDPGIGPWPVRASINGGRLPRRHAGSTAPARFWPAPSSSVGRPATAVMEETAFRLGRPPCGDSRGGLVYRAATISCRCQPESEPHAPHCAESC
jgi:hypothetical protein